MQSREPLTLAPLKRRIGWMIAGLCILLVLLGAGDIILRSFNRRYRDLTVFIMCALFTALCVLLALYLAMGPSRRLRGFLWRAALWLLLSALIWCVCAGLFIWNYHGELNNDDAWYAPPGKIVFNDGFLAVIYIRVYEPGSLFWTGPLLLEQ